ncbi:MAG TPA: PilZ domain-containing protein, partial [Thiomicrospira sp.]|nr:PilZ domain-containing protein [Thiomicrospira sp.]
MTTVKTTDKRRNLRFPSSRPVLMILDGKNIYATMTDFSRHGIGFISNEKSSLHKRIEVHFDVPNSIKQPTIIPFKFMAEIKHCISTQDNECHIGVRL